VDTLIQRQDRPGAKAGTQNHKLRRVQSGAGSLSQLPGVSVSDVAESLYIHPFMLFRWRKMTREGQIVT
jgi:transposase